MAGSAFGGVRNPCASQLEDVVRVDPHGSSRTTWFVISAIGYLLFELTANPALAVALGCFKAGRDAFRTARRLRLEDPDPVRRRVCARFHRAWGLWKISITATVVRIALNFTMNSRMLDRKQENRVPELQGGTTSAFLVAMVGFVWSATISAQAVVTALRGQVKLWVDVRTNRAKAVLLTAIITAVTLFWLTLFIVCVGWLRIGEPAVGLIVTLMGVVFGAPFMIPSGLEWLERRIIARSPNECWSGLFDPMAR